MTLEKMATEEMSQEKRHPERNGTIQIRISIEHLVLLNKVQYYIRI